MGRIPKVEKEKALEVFHQEGSDFNKLELKIEQTGSGSYDFKLNPKENQRPGTSQVPNDVQGSSQTLQSHISPPLFNMDKRSTSQEDSFNVDENLQNFKYSADPVSDNLPRPADMHHRVPDLGYGFQFGGQSSDKTAFKNSHLTSETAVSMFDEDLLKCDPNPAQVVLKQESGCDDYQTSWQGHHQPSSSSSMSRDCELSSTYHAPFKEPFLHDRKNNPAVPMFQNTNNDVFGPNSSKMNPPMQKNTNMYDFDISQPKTNDTTVFDSSKPMFAQNTTDFLSPVNNDNMFDVDTYNAGRTASNFPPSFPQESQSDSIIKSTHHHHHYHHSRKDPSSIHHSVFSSPPQTSQSYFNKTDNAFSVIEPVVQSYGANNEHSEMDRFSGWRHGMPFPNDKNPASFNQLPQYSRQDPGSSKYFDMSSPQKIGLTLPNMKTCTPQSWASVPSSPDIRSCATPSSITSHEGSSASQPGRYNPVLIKVLVEQVLESNKGVDIMEKLKVKLNDSEINQDAAQKLLNLVKQVSSRRRSSADDSSVDSGHCGINNSALAAIPEDKTEALARFLNDVRNSAMSPQSTNSSGAPVTHPDYHHRHKRTISEAGLYQSFENLDMKKSAFSGTHCNKSVSSKKTTMTDLTIPSSPCTQSLDPGLVVRADSCNDIVTSTDTVEEEEVNMQSMKVLLEGLNLGMKILFRYKPEHREKLKMYMSGKVS